MAEWHGDDIDPESVVEPEPEEGGDAAVAKIKKLKDEIESLRKEKQEYLDGWQRSKADYVNLLKRSEADAKASKFSGLVQSVETLLPAFDALERAKEHLPVLAPGEAGGEAIAGFAAIARQIEAGFAALGLEAVGNVGEKFDPALHEALGQDTVQDEAQDDTITSVLERGWRVGTTIIRPAKVRVAHFAGE